MSDAHPVMRAYRAATSATGRIVLSMLTALALYAAGMASGWVVSRWNLPAVNAARLDRIDESIVLMRSTDAEILKKLESLDRTDAMHAQALAVITTRLDSFGKTLDEGVRDIKRILERRP